MLYFLLSLIGATVGTGSGLGSFSFSAGEYSAVGTVLSNSSLSILNMFITALPIILPILVILLAIGILTKLFKH